MVLIRKRYYVWLIREYVKKWKRSIFVALFLGVAAFFLFLLFFKFYIQPIFQGKVEKIGVIGAYTIDNLPNTILQDISYGLTKINKKGEIEPAAAEKYDITDNGNKYTFYLKPGQFFQNKKELTADNFPLSFKDVESNKIGKYSVSFKLKNPYSPFLAAVAKPILLKGLIGLGEYAVKNVTLNAGFVKYIELQNINNRMTKKEIFFYPTSDALKVAFALGEVDKAEGIDDLYLKNSNFSDWKNATVEKSVNYGKLVTLFYDNSEQNLSDKKLRQALNYSLPNTFPEGERAYSPIRPGSIFYNPQINSANTLDVAKAFFAASSAKNGFKIELSTTGDLLKVAQEVKKAWENLGIQVTIKVYEDPPTDFQVLLYYYKVPQDPDQYTLWHSDKINNITRYKNLRIDKLLEDGRITTNIDERIKMYRDFQKYILDDSPASFLYFPYEYNVTRGLR